MKKKKKKPKFRIGQWVEFKAHTTKDYLGTNSVNVNKRKIVKRKIVMRLPLGTPLRGQIIGARYRMEGTVHPGGYEDQEQAYFIPSKSVLVWLVATGYINKPYEVLEKDIGFTVSSDGFRLPWRKTWMSKRERERLSKESQDWPRDSKGRFC